MIRNQVNNIFSLPRILVFFQFAALLAMMFAGPFFVDQIWGLISQLSALSLGVWAVLIMGIGNFNITPTPKKNGAFIYSGPYHLIRHPMYTSIFLFVIPELVFDFSNFRLGSFIVLFIILMIKLNYEEKLLLKKFEEYESYMKKTKRIIPYIF